MAIHLKRIYEPIDAGDGYRVLVDGLWPRGLSRDDLNLDEWIRHIAPSARLRKWFGHDRSRWGEFRRRYLSELKDHRKELRSLAERSQTERVTILFAARDEACNNAVVVSQYLKMLGGDGATRDSGIR